MNAGNCILASVTGYRMSRMLCRAHLLIVLLAFFVSTTSYAEYRIRGEGKNQSFCEAILATLNKTTPYDDKLPCVSELVFKMPGVSDPPWEKLDLEKHEKLAGDIMLVNSVGVSEFFAEQKSPVPGFWPKPGEIEKSINYLKKNGGELFAFRSPPDPDKLIVTLRHPNEMCGRPLQLPFQPRGESASAAWVTPDLKRIARLEHHYGRGKRPLLHRGRLYFVNLNRDDELQLFLPHFTGGFTPPVCSIQYISSTRNNSKGQAK